MKLDTIFSTITIQSWEQLQMAFCAPVVPKKAHNKEGEEFNCFMMID